MKTISSYAKNANVCDLSTLARLQRIGTISIVKVGVRFVSVKQLFLMNEGKLQELLRLVIDHYIGKGDPIGSKFLNSLESIQYAPSTLRKYLNVLEKEGMLYQPYNSAGRIPTAKGLSSYLDDILEDETPHEYTDVDFELDGARSDLRSLVEKLGKHVDGASVGFLKEDEYFYLGLNNLLKETLIGDYETTRYLIKFIESKKIIQTLDSKLIKKGNVYYTFLEDENKMISIVYTKYEVEGYDAMLAVLGHSRVDHRKNVTILKQLIESGELSDEMKRLELDEE